MQTKDERTYPLTVQVDLPAEFIYSVMVTMVETPFGHWFQFGEIQRREDLMIITFAVLPDDPEEGEGVKMVHYRTVNPHLVVQGIEAILAGRVHLGFPRAYIQDAVAEKDAGHIDAIAADAILQACVYGEIVYG